jgi:hypothetical protein
MYSLFFSSIKISRSLLRQKAELMGVILETLSNLNLDPTTNLKLKSQMVASVASCNPSFVPELVYFILSDLEPANMRKFVACVRDKLELFQQKPSNSTQQISNNKSSDSSDMSLLAYRVSCLLGDENLAKVWKRAIEESATRRPSDLLVILILQSMETFSGKPVVALVKSKVVHDVFCPAMIDDVMRDAPEIVESYMKQYLEISCALMAIPEPVVYSFGCEMLV